MKQDWYVDNPHAGPGRHPPPPRAAFGPLPTDGGWAVGVKISIQALRCPPLAAALGARPQPAIAEVTYVTYGPAATVSSVSPGAVVPAEEVQPTKPLRQSCSSRRGAVIIGVIATILVIAAAVAVAVVMIRRPGGAFHRKAALLNSGSLCCPLSPVSSLDSSDPFGRMP